MNDPIGLLPIKESREEKKKEQKDNFDVWCQLAHCHSQLYNVLREGNTFLLFLISNFRFEISMYS